MQVNVASSRKTPCSNEADIILMLIWTNSRSTYIHVLLKLVATSSKEAIGCTMPRLMPNTSMQHYDFGGIISKVEDNIWNHIAPAMVIDSRNGRWRSLSEIVQMSNWDHYHSSSSAALIAIGFTAGKKDAPTSLHAIWSSLGARQDIVPHFKKEF